MKFEDYKIEYEIKEVEPKKTSIIGIGIKYALIKTIAKLFETVSRIFFFVSYLIPIGIINFIFILCNGKALRWNEILLSFAPLLCYFFGYITALVTDYFEEMAS